MFCSDLYYSSQFCSNQRFTRCSRSGLLISRTGFTLIELLVVIAIIAILVAMLFPVFALARESARRTSCLSNVKQLTLAFAQYTQDYDEVLPAGSGGVSNKPGGWIYFNRTPANVPRRGPQPYEVTRGSIYPYVKNKQVYVCPDDNEGKISGDSYAANSCIFVGNGYGFHAGKHLAAFEDTSSWMLFAEEASFDPLRSSTDDGYFYIVSDTQHNVFSKRHLGGSNLSFLDGHCKALRDSTVIAGKYHTGGENVPCD